MHREFVVSLIEHYDYVAGNPRQKAFHGRTGYTMSLTNTDPNKVARYPKFDWPRIPAPSINGSHDIEADEAAALAAARAAFVANPHDIACFIMEVVITMMFLFIIMGATHGSAPAGFAPLAIGLALVMIHLVSIPVTNTSVNPARSTGPALFAGGEYVAQLWLFWVAPIVGALIAGFVTRWLHEPVVITESVMVIEESERTA